jgi:hypothetical protein
MSLLRQYSERELWILRQYLKAAGNMALAGGCGFGLMFLQSNKLAIPLWATMIIWFSAAVIFLNGLLELKDYFGNAQDARSAFLTSIAAVFLAPAFGGILGTLILAAIRGWIP